MDEITVDLEGRAAAAQYIAALSGDLAEIARRHDLYTLCYLLELAKLEGNNAARPTDSQDEG